MKAAASEEPSLRLSFASDDPHHARDLDFGPKTSPQHCRSSSLSATKHLETAENADRSQRALWYEVSQPAGNPPVQCAARVDAQDDLARAMAAHQQQPIAARWLRRLHFLLKTRTQLRRGKAVCTGSGLSA